jgi:rhodanese-related sulfurtransferase
MDDVKQIDTTTLKNWLATGKEVSILDIRPIKERLYSLIPGSIHVDVYDKLKQNDVSAFDDLHLDKSIPVVTFCAGGNTSLIAAEMLVQKGYDALSLEGGITKWDQQKIGDGAN